MENIHKKESDIIWKNNIYETLTDLSDIECQKLTWSGKHPEFISSFTETLGMLYDSYDFKSYIENYKMLNGENTLYIMFKEVDKMISSYEVYGFEIEKKNNGHLRILEDEKWILITEKSKEIVKQWLPPLPHE